MRCKMLRRFLVLLLVCITSTPVGAQKRLALSYRQVAFFQMPHLATVAWKPDGTELAVVSYPSIWLWDVDSQKLRVLIADAQVSNVAWSPNGNKIAAVQGGEDESLLIWDAATGALVKRITRVEPHRAYLYLVAWSPDGNKIASDGTGRYILIWNLFGDEKVYPLEGGSGRFSAPYWKSDSHQVASSASDGIHIWDIATGQNTLTIPHAEIDDWHSMSNRMLGRAEDTKAYVWDSTTGQSLLRLDLGASVLSAKWNFNESMIASGDINGIIRISDSQTGDLLAVVKKHVDLITALAWHPAQNLLAATSYDGSVSIWQFDVN